MKDRTELNTGRLLLRGYKLSDIPSIVRLIGTREIAATTLRIPFPYTEKDARQLLRQMEKDSPRSRFGIFLRETGELCGGIGLRLELEHDRAELGYWVGVPFWGKGIASEAAREVVRYGFENLGLHRIYATCHADNTASLKILQHLGMKYEGRAPHHVKKWDEYKDIENYGLLVDDWKAGRL